MLFTGPALKLGEIGKEDFGALVGATMLERLAVSETLSGGGERGHE